MKRWLRWKGRADAGEDWEQEETGSAEDETDPVASHPTWMGRGLDDSKVWRWTEPGVLRSADTLRIGSDWQANDLELVEYHEKQEIVERQPFLVRLSRKHIQEGLSGFSYVRSVFSQGHTSNKGQQTIYEIFETMERFDDNDGFHNDRWDHYYEGQELGNLGHYGKEWIYGSCFTRKCQIFKDEVDWGEIRHARCAHEICEAQINGSAISWVMVSVRVNQMTPVGEVRFAEKIASVTIGHCNIHVGKPYLQYSRNHITTYLVP